MDALPFFHRPDGDKKPSYWHVVPIADYRRACNIGRDYAQQYLQFLRANPDWIGCNILSKIAADIDYDDPDTKGYWIGFFSFLEGVLSVAPVETPARRYDERFPSTGHGE